MWSTHSRRIDPISRFGKAILPGRGRCGRLVPDAHGAQSARDDRTIDAIPVVDHAARSFIPRECFCDLSRNPFRGRICCDADPGQFSAIEPDDDEGIEQGETDSWNNEQIHCGNVRRVVTQEGPAIPAIRESGVPYFDLFGTRFFGSDRPDGAASSPWHGQESLKASKASVMPGVSNRSGFWSRYRNRTLALSKMLPEPGGHARTSADRFGEKYMAVSIIPSHAPADRAST